MNFVSALKEFESLKSDLGRYRYQMKVDDSVIVSFCQKLGSLLSHFYTSNLIINSFGGDLIPIKFNANRLNGNERIQMLDKLLESILNDIKLKESEEILTPKESNQIESLKSNYNDLMQERNEVVVKHNELVTELDDLYPKIQKLENQNISLEQRVRKATKWLAIVSALLLTTLNFGVFVISDLSNWWVLIIIQVLIAGVFISLKTGKIPIVKKQPLKEFGIKFLNDFLVKFTVAITLLGLAYLIYHIFGVHIKF